MYYDGVVFKPSLGKLYLEHHGIKGQKWGVRKSIESYKKKQKFISDRSKKYKSQDTRKNPLVNKTKSANRKARVDYYKEVKGYSEKKSKAVVNTQDVVTTIIGAYAGYKISQLVMNKKSSNKKVSSIPNKYKSSPINDLDIGPQMITRKDGTVMRLEDYRKLRGMGII